MNANELIRRNYTDEEFYSLINSNKTIQKSLGWSTPPSGRRESDPIVEVPKQEDYVSLRNTYSGKNYWEYISCVGCIGFTNRYEGDSLDGLKEVSIDYNPIEEVKNNRIINELIKELQKAPLSSGFWEIGFIVSKVITKNINEESSIESFMDGFGTN